jgi:outer membrane biosynthesis protein TonB
LNLTNQHKALLITLLISGSVVLSVFNLSLKQQNELASESYYEVEPEKELTKEEIKILEALESLNNSKAETNKAFNESEKSNHFAQAFKPIAPPDDYVPKEINHSDNVNNSIKKYENTEDSKLNQEELSKFSKVNDLLKQQQSDGNNSKSSISFSLVNRTKVHIPIPIYLCEVDGKIVVNINVDSNGNVTEAYLNTSSTSDNACLIEHALQYAEQSQFSASPSKQNQVGSITFFFIGKR